MKTFTVFAGFLAVHCLMAASATAAAEPPAGVPENYRLLYEQTFDNASALEGFVFTDPKAWKFAKTDQASALALAAQSKYKPPFRSPVNIALIADKAFGDFVLEADLVQTGREYGHRDMCLFFGFQDPAHFYYVHMATAADPNAHNVFIVNGAARTNFAAKTTKGVNWGLEIWHKVRLVRNAATGSIRVYFDDLKTPIMEAESKTFPSGAIGFGSFDDTGMVDNIRIWGPAVEPKKTPRFSAPKPPSSS